MSDHHCCEEQEMEAEALTAIFDAAFEIISNSQPFEWSVKLLPVDCGGDAEQEDVQNHVIVKLVAKIPLDYPENSLPELDVQIVKGLAEEHRQELQQLAQTEAENNEGMPAIFAICEALREWLGDNNTKGLDDASMHAQMMRRAKEAEKSKALAAQQFESQKIEEEMTEAEMEELTIRKRRAEGTPCNKENFEAWKVKFEMEQLKLQEEQAAAAADKASGKKSKQQEKKIVDKSDRLTGFEQFSNKVGILNLEAIEAAAEQVENEIVDELDADEFDEDLFDDEGDVDLDDLDFDDEDDFDDDDEEEPDI